MCAKKAFSGEKAYLSNFYECPVHVFGLDFNSSEAAFQSQKDPERADEFCRLDPKASKLKGSEVCLRKDWDDVKDDIMREVVNAKFMQNPDLAEKLKDESDRIEEINSWNDTYWGICNGTGKNMLGKILMEVREYLLNQE